jgi:hypothetical protein
MQHGQSSQPLALANLIAVAGVAAMLRAAGLAVADGYATHGLFAVAVQSASRHYLLGFGVALLALLVLAMWRRRGGDALFVALLASVGGFRFFLVTAPSLPPDVVLASARSSLDVRQEIAALAALGVVALFALRARLPSALVVWGARLSCALVAITLVAVATAHVRSASSPEKPNVILIELDDLRADRLGCQGYPRPTTPEIDRFARGAVRFERAFSPTPSTLAAHMTLLTGLLPILHQVTPTTSLPADAPTLAGELRQHGFTTIAQTDDDPWLHPRFGFAQGFDVFRRVAGDAARKNEALEPLLDDLRSQRFFLYLNYHDAAADDATLAYESSVEDRAVLVPAYGGEYRGCDAALNCGARWIAAHSVAGSEPDAATIRHLSNLYDAGVRGLDREIGHLFRMLEERGLLETSIVVITSDHGEAFFEHGAGLHRDLHVECTAVPLIVRPAGGTNERSLTPLVGIVDIAPTLLEMCGIEARKELQGESLASLVRGSIAPREHLFVLLDSSVVSDTPPSSGVRKASGFLLWTDRAPALFETSLDPGELHPLSLDERAAAWKALEQILDRESRGATTLRERMGKPARLEPFGADVRRKLVRLGEPFPGDAAFDSSATTGAAADRAGITSERRD